MKVILALLILAAVLCPAAADELREAYTAHLSEKDHFSSTGVRLDSAAAIIRQDRANYHKFNRRDADDGEDLFFSKAANRELLEKLLERGSSNRAVMKKIVNGTPYVNVSIYQSERTGQDYVVVRILD